MGCVEKVEQVRKRIAEIVEKSKLEDVDDIKALAKKLLKLFDIDFSPVAYKPIFVKSDMALVEIVAICVDLEEDDYIVAIDINLDGGWRHVDVRIGRISWLDEFRMPK